MKFNGGIKYGIFAGIGLIAYFLIMKLLGFEKIMGLRMFNLVIIAAAIFLLFKSMFGRNRNNDFAYFDGLFAGLTVTIVSIVIFVAFMGCYILFWDNEFRELIVESGLFGNSYGIAEALIGILIEGVVSGAIVSFILMQYFKKETVKRDIPERKKGSNGYEP